MMDMGKSQEFTNPVENGTGECVTGRGGGGDFMTIDDSIYNLYNLILQTETTPSLSETSQASKWELGLLVECILSAFDRFLFA